MTKITISLIPLLGILLFPFLTSIINERDIKEKAKYVLSPQNITRIRERGADEPAIAFTEWMKEIGIIRGPVEIRPLAPGIRAVFAARDIQTGEIVYDIPLHAMIPEDFPSEDPVILKAQRLLKDNRLLSIIVYQELRNPKSKFRPYFDLFPKYFGNFPLFYNEEDMAMVRGTNIGAQIESYRQVIKSRYHEVMQKMAPEVSMGEQEYYRMYIHAASRCLTLKIHGVNQFTLVPAFDMLNAYTYTRDELDSVRIEFLSDRDEPILRLNARKFLKEGEEVFDYYRKDYTNTDYLINYGFVFSEIDDISLRFTFDYQEGDPLIPLKRELAGLLMGGPSEKQLTVTLKNSSKEEDYWHIYSHARIIELKSKPTLERMLFEVKNGERKIVGRINNDNEKRAMNLLLNTVEDILSKHPSTLEEDNRLINEYPMFSTPRNIVQVRRQEKLVLMKIRDYARGVMTEILKK